METITIQELRNNLRDKYKLQQGEYLSEHFGKLYSDSQWQKIITSWDGKPSLEDYAESFTL